MPPSIGVPGARLASHSLFTACRVVTQAGVASAALLYMAHRRPADAALQAWWGEVRGWRFVRMDSFEPVAASVGFFWAIALFRILDRCTVLEGFKINPLDGWPQPSAGSFLPPKHALLSLTLYLGPLFVFDATYQRRMLPEQAPSIPSLFAQVAASVGLYDFLFFWCHLAMHKVPSLRFFNHTVHHTKANLDATEVLRHSLLDGTLQVAINIVTLNLLQNHPLSRAMHNMIVTYLLAESHSGYDFPFMLQNIIPFGIYGGSIAHEAHHVSGVHHYQQFFTYLDRSLGSVCAIGMCLVLACSAIATFRWFAASQSPLGLGLLEGQNLFPGLAPSTGGAS